MTTLKPPAGIDSNTWTGIIANVARSRRERKAILTSEEEEAIKSDDQAEYRRSVDRAESAEFRRKFTNELGFIDPDDLSGWSR